MAKRDYVTEILKARPRGREAFALSRLQGLIVRMDQADAAGYLEYFPVAAIAALESVFRRAVRQLVDFGPPYSNRAGDVVHDAKVEVPALHAFHGRRLSVGDFVAHLVPFRGFDDIDKALTTLLDSSFLGAIKTVEDSWEKRAMGRTEALVLPSHGPVFEDVQTLIDLRHKLAHEVPHPSPITDIVVLRRQLNSTERFAFGINEIVSQIVQPNAPLTQQEMNMAAYERTKDADAVMEQIYNSGLAGMVGYERDAFEASQHAFLEYRTMASRSSGFRAEGGSIRPMIESLEYDRLTRQRAEDLRRVLKSLEDPPDD